jgi:hypothetical protein
MIEDVVLPPNRPSRGKRRSFSGIQACILDQSPLETKEEYLMSDDVSDRYTNKNYALEYPSDLALTYLVIMTPLVWVVRTCHLSQAR